MSILNPNCAQQCNICMGHPERTLEDIITVMLLRWSVYPDRYLCFVSIYCSVDILCFAIVLLKIHAQSSPTAQLFNETFCACMNFSTSERSTIAKPTIPAPKPTNPKVDF